MFLGLIDHTHAAAAEPLDDAVVRDGLPNHAQGCYGGKVGKSMKAGELRNIKRIVGVKSPSLRVEESR